jgi:2-keto-3-deoxy-L-rhamnonate aldolase RhmA
MKLTADFRKKVLGRQWVCGTFLNLGSPMTVELAGNAGYDWLLIDHEHGSFGEETMFHQLQAAAATPAFPIVRIAWNEVWRFKRALDAGAYGIMVPFINTAAEAKAAADAMHYPPHGVRGVAKFNRGAGFGTSFEEYYQSAHERLVLVAQIETPEAVANIDGIAGVKGVDVVFVGPTDLSYTMGIRDQLESDKFKEALRKVADGAKRQGKAAGILIHSPKLVPMVKELGYTFVALSSDGGAVSAGLKASLEALRG